MKEIEPKSMPVVVLQSGRHGALGVARSLGRLGVPVYVIDSSRWPPASASRYVRGQFRWDIEKQTADRSVEFLLEVGRKLGGRSLLVPTTDFGAMFVEKYAGRLQSAFA